MDHMDEMLQRSATPWSRPLPLSGPIHGRGSDDYGYLDYQNSLRNSFGDSSGGQYCESFGPNSGAYFAGSYFGGFERFWNGGPNQMFEG